MNLRRLMMQNCPVEDEAYQRAELCITVKICRRWQRGVNSGLQPMSDLGPLIP